MSKAKKTKAPKVTKAGRERGLAAVAKEKAAAKTPIAAKPATSDTSKVKGAEAQDAATPAHDVGRGRAAKSKATRKAKRSKKAATEGHGPREGSKTAIILDLIRRPKGATLEELMAAAGWQAHSVRGMLSAVVTKKMGLKLQSTKREDGQRVYQLAS
jgi:hypothetical protein